MDKLIEKALKQRQKIKPDGPSNVFDLPKEELLNLGYRQLLPKETFQDGDLMDLAGENFWAITSNTKYVKKCLGSGVVGSVLFLRK